MPIFPLNCPNTSELGLSEILKISFFFIDINTTLWLKDRIYFICFQVKLFKTLLGLLAMDERRILFNGGAT